MFLVVSFNFISAPFSLKVGIRDDIVPFFCLFIFAWSCSDERERLSFETKRNGKKDVTENVEQPGWRLRASNLRGWLDLGHGNRWKRNFRIRVRRPFLRRLWWPAFPTRSLFRFKELSTTRIRCLTPVRSVENCSPLLSVLLSLSDERWPNKTFRN